jgi:hypothetical protein
MAVKKFTTENLEVPPQNRDMKELSQNFSSQRKNLKKHSPRFSGNNMETHKHKTGDCSPPNNKVSVVSGISIISQLSFIKTSFTSPNAQADANKAASQKSFEQISLMQEESETPTGQLRSRGIHQGSRTELRQRKQQNLDDCR